MSLFQKCVVFVSTILFLQVVVFGGFATALFKAEEAANRVAYSNRVVAAQSRIAEAFYGSAHALMVMAITQDPKWGARCDEFFEGLTGMVADLKSDRWAQPDDKSDLERISKIMKFTIGELSSARESIQSATTPGEFAGILRLFTINTNPHLSDLTELANRLAARHRMAEQALLAQRQLSARLRSVVLVGFLLNIAATIAVVFGFSRGVNRRINIIADNFIRYATAKQLHPAQSGGDEISLLDYRFHELSDALSEAAAKDKAVFENSPVALVTTRTDGKIETLNQESMQLFMVTDEQSLKLADFFEIEDDFDQVQAGIEQGKISALRTCCRRADGTVFPAEVSVSVFKLKRERRALLAILDISDREKIDSLRREFVAVVSHDIRTPLTSIRACLTLFEQGSFGAVSTEGQRHLKVAQKESERLMRLTTDLLEIARIESGNVELDLSVLNVSELVTSSIEAVRLAAQWKNVMLSSNVGDLRIYADEERVIQILVNFLSNAIKFTEQGKNVLITAESQESCVQINIIDEGCGIPQEQLTKIFDRFKQARRSDARRGTGLGLAICRLLAEQHGGSVGVTSTEGKGSTFWVRLPADLTVSATAS